MRNHDDLGMEGPRGHKSSPFVHFFILVYIHFSITNRLLEIAMQMELRIYDCNFMLGPVPLTAVYFYTNAALNGNKTTSQQCTLAVLSLKV